MMNNDKTIVSTNQQKLSQYSSDVVKKGLDLAGKIHFPNQSKAELYLRLGVEKLQEGDYQSTLSYFEKALKINPDYYEVYILRSSLIYYPLGEYKAVISDYNQVLKLNPKNSEAYHNRGYAYALLGHHIEAIKNYNMSLTLEPNFIQAYINRGLSCMALEKYNQAISDFNKVIAINPNNADAYNNRGLIYNNFEKYEKALRDFNQALRISPDKAKFYLNRALAYLRLNKYIEAIEDYDQALKLDPQSCQEYFQQLEELLEVVNKSQEFLSQGDKNNEQGNLKEAIKNYTLALKYNSKNTYAYNNRGLTYFCLGHFENALNDFNQALQNTPDYTLAYLNRSRILMCLGQYQESIEDINQALELDSECCEQFFNQCLQGMSYLVDQFDEQIIQNLFIYLIKCFLLQAEVQHELANYYGAIESCNTVLSFMPNNSEAYQQRSLSRSELGDILGALEDLQKALQCS